MLHIIYSILFILVLILIFRFWPFILFTCLFIWFYKRIKKPKDSACEVVSKKNVKTKDLEGMDLAMHISKKTSEKK